MSASQQPLWHKLIKDYQEMDILVEGMYTQDACKNFYGIDVVSHVSTYSQLISFSYYVFITC